MYRTTVVLLGALLALVSRPAEACGCFAPTTTVTPVVQAGERILFAVNDGKVTAHIQIQYQGDARNFGWLLPLPSVPTLKAGTEELFQRLLAETDPVYVTQGNVKCRSISFGCAASAPVNRGVFENGTKESDAGTGPAVKQGSVGPYEYAVLSAADKNEMIKWLNDNRFFIPAGTEGAVDPYIGVGSYFLALKLRSDRDAGDVTPVVVEYAASYPMIPLVLTSVGATPNMGVQVWLLGSGRGVPRNYAHVVLNDAVLDWENSVSNYVPTVTRAVGEAPGKHAFVTEYAGPSAPLKLDLTRFGSQEELANAASPTEFINLLKARRFGVDGDVPPQLVSVITNELPVPTPMATRGTSAQQWVEGLGYFLGAYRDQNPDDFVGYTATFDAPTLAARIFTDYVPPIREAFALFDQWPKLTRLFTTLSPEDMTADPVFAFNAALPDVDRTHRGTQDFGCGTPEVTTEQGWVYKTDENRSALPAALTIATVPEEGAPTILTNNIPAIGKKVRITEGSPLSSQLGCSVDPLTLVAGAAVFGLRRRRRAR